MWLDISLFALLVPFAVLAWFSRRWAILVILVSISAYVIRINIVGVPTTWLELAIYVVLAISLIRDNWAGFIKEKLLFFSKWLLPIIIWLSSSVIGVLVAADVRIALGVWKGFIIDPLLLCALVLLVTWQSSRVIQWWSDILLSLMIGASLTTILAAIQSWITQAGRLQSGYDSPNVLAMYLAPILVAGFLFFLFNKAKFNNSLFYQSVWILNLVCLTVGVYFTNSYSAWVAVVAAIVFSILLISVPKFGRSIAVLSVFFSLLLPFVIAATQWGILSGHTNAVYGVNSGEVRLIMWSQAVTFIKDNPVFGLGLGQWQQAFNNEATVAGWLSIKNPGLAIELIHSSLYPHNLWLTTWLASGLLGVIVLLWLAIMAIMEVKNKCTVIPVAALLVQIIHGSLDTPLWKNDLAIIWWLAIAAVIWWQQDKSINSADYA